MIINHNMGAMNANRQMGINASNAGKSMEKLSSGLRINRAGDDAAGLAISEKMRGQIRGLDQASANSQDGISLLQTAEGALNETTSMLQRVRELTVQANNGTNQAADREQIQSEITQLLEEVTNVANKTQFNKQNLLNGDLGAKTANAGSDLVTGSGALKISDVTGASVGVGYAVVATATDLTVTNAAGTISQTIDITATATVNVGDTYNFDAIGITLSAQDTDISGVGLTPANGLFDVTASGIDLQTGANNGDQMAVSINAMDSTALGINLIDVGAGNYDSAQFDLDILAIDAATALVSAERAKLGAFTNRLEHTIANLGTSSENLTSAESRIRDVDMAKEMSTFSKNNILAQAAQAMLAQANQQPQQVLQLLR